MLDMYTSNNRTAQCPVRGVVAPGGAPRAGPGHRAGQAELHPQLRGPQARVLAPPRPRGNHRHRIQVGSDNPFIKLYDTDIYFCVPCNGPASLDTCSKCGNQFMIVVCRNLRFLNNFPEISSKRSTSWNKFINVNTWSNATSANTPEILFLWLLKAKVYLWIC